MATRKKPRGPVRNSAPKQPAWFDAWHRTTPRRRHAVAATVLVLAGLVFMAPALFGDGVLVGSDIVHFKAMSKGLVDAKEATGNKPLWAVRPFAGMPAYMISYDLAVPQVDQLAGQLRGLMWPLSHLLILFAGTYLLVFLLTRNRLAGMLSAVTFGLTTYLPVLLVAGHNTKFIALAYLPWLLLAFVHALRRPGLLAGLLFAVTVALNLRAGHVQITYFGAFMMAVWWVVEAVSTHRHGQGREFRLATTWLFAGGILGILMVADPYLLHREFRDFTIRGESTGGTGGGMGWTYAMAWSQGLGEMLTLFVANAFGGSGATYWGPKSFTAGPHYVGGVALMLAVVALLRSRHRTVAALAIAGVLMIGFALGENLAVLNRLMFDHFPLFDLFRVPETWMAPVTLVIAVLAGIGLGEAMAHDRDAQEDARRTRAVYQAAGIAAALALVLFLAGDLFLSYEKPGEFESLVAQVGAQRPDLSLDDPRVRQALVDMLSEQRADRADLFSADARRTLIFLVLAGVLLVFARRRRLPGWAAGFALVVLVAVDLGGVGRRYLNADVLMPERAVDQGVPTYPFDPYLAAKMEEAGGEGHFRVLSLEGDPTVTARPAYFYESLGGYHGAKLRRYQDFLESMLFAGPRGLNPNAIRMANVHYVVSNQPMPGMTAEFVDDQTGFTVFRVGDALPRAWFVDSVEVMADPAQTWARLADPEFDPGWSVVVPEDPGLAPSPRDSASVVDAGLDSYTAERIVWTVETDRPRFLVVSEVYYPAGWIARIDGEEVPIHPANHTFRGIVVPAGRHEVSMSFEPAMRTTAVWVSGASTALVYGAVVWILVLAGMRRRRKGDEDA